ncbi:MAG: hypothetical protein OXT74_04320 [Candidatus Poribacteria bacterium]|nr:hypothetical protein [Candidatus Poribacteria bacterium]
MAHEHCLINHTHDLVEYPTAQFIWEDPWIGKLTYDGQQWILVVFSQLPIGLTVTDVPNSDNR